MLKTSKVSTEKLFRILDANFNRAKEGLRVCEDVCRFALDDKYATSCLKNIRHALSDVVISLGIKRLFLARDIDSDVGRKSVKLEFKRKDLDDVFYANIQRVKESMRVLEEFLKLVSPRKSESLKALRYKVYAVEKKITKGL